MKSHKQWETKSGHQITQILSGRSNVFLLSNGKQNILIDTSPRRKWNALVKRLRNLNIHRLDYLILTHSHFDHSDNASMIRNEFNAKVIVHKDEASCLLNGGFMMIKGTNWITAPLVRILGKLLAHRLRCKPCPYDVLVEELLDLKEFGFNAYLIHTPGHSAGSMSMIVDDEIALVGDAMFGVFKGSIFPPFASDTKQMVESWGKLLTTSCSLFIPSHGSANGRALVQEEYDKREGQ
jgi:hydroxyacylglutathione hydrolase